MNSISEVYSQREQYSKDRLGALRSAIGSSQNCTDYPELTIIGAGSFARLEGSRFSDIDVFFLCAKDRKDIPEPRTKELRLFSSMIDIIETLDFPKFSNDCEFLNVLHSEEIIRHLGGPLDDHKNYFTARMLLLLESKCLYGEKIYNEIIESIIKSYFLDFHDHKESFQPIFLLNDICRYWKTLLLNYESRRQPTQDTAKKIKQKVKNFKLKYSRMTTCFATIAALGCYNSPINQQQVVEMVGLTPRERLQKIPEQLSETTPAVNSILEEYAWFLDKTGLPIDELESYFDDREKRTVMFERANRYGRLMFDLIKIIDSSNCGAKELMRYLVI